MTPESIDETPDGSASAGADDASALLSRLRVIEDQPLESRAAAFVHIHDRLQATLEGSVRESNRDRGVDMSNTNG
jgi:hypothetical protein